MPHSKKLAAVSIGLILWWSVVPPLFAQEPASESASLTEASQSGLMETPLEAATSSAKEATQAAEPVLSIEPIEETLSLVKQDQDAAVSARLRQAIRVRSLSKRTFRADEKITVVLDNTLNANAAITLFDSDGREVIATIEMISDYDPTVFRINPPNHLRPGRYRIKITDPSGEVTTQDFSWGVLAINPDKATYLPNETSQIAMAVLDETGNMVCDAQVSLKIRKIPFGEDFPTGPEEELSTINGRIIVNPECSTKDFVLKPDYETTYQVGGPGTYQMALTAETAEGSHTIEDAFEVRETIAFDIKRLSATRIFPPKSYPMRLDIVAAEDFEGSITEMVPGSFAVLPLEGTTNFSRIDRITSATASAVMADALVPTLPPPFDELHPINLDFGEQLRDPILTKKYADFGLLGHDGIDFDLAEGTPVLSVDDGTVARVRQNGDYGATVVIQHAWGKSYYGHLSLITAKEGDRILRGHPLGLSGSTGLSTGPHLHFGIKPNDNDMENGYYGKINPMPYLAFKQGNQDVLGAQIQAPEPVVVATDTSEAQIVRWDVSLKKGQKSTLGYSYQVPNISPQFYLLGPLTFENKEAQVFTEGRRWQLGVDASGSGANSVSPSTGSMSSTGNTYTFTFDPSEAMNSGGITITVPSSGSPDWSAPQGSTGTAGYTVAAGTGNATVADVLVNADVEDPASPAGKWEEYDVDMCGNATTQDAVGDIVVDAVNKQEGAGSIQCVDTNGGPDSGDAWGWTYDANQDWTTACSGGACTQIGYWVRSPVNTEAAEFEVSSTTDLNAGQLGANCTLTITSINTWEYKTCSLSGLTLSTVRSFGFICTAAACNPFETDSVNIDEVLIGPGVATFAGRTATVRFLDLADTETVTVTYGSGGGASGVQNSSTEGAHTFTTASMLAAGGSYVSLSGGSPTITLSSGPTNDQLLRHGAWFSGDVEQPFTF